MTLLEQFRFLDPGPLVDGELELVTPAQRWVGDLLRTLGHPLTRKLATRDSQLTREQITKFCRDYPMGRQPADPEKGFVPAYHFWMRITPRGRTTRSTITIAGGINLRVGHTANLELYLGNIGYNVYPPARGRRYAARAVRLLLPLARRSGVNPVWITCNPENAASRRTCELAGGKYVNVVPLPADHTLYARGEREKCRFRFDL